MILKNLVFDIGNVLVSYQPLEFHLRKGTGRERAMLYLKDIYHSEEWQRLDQGTISLTEAIGSIAEKSSLPLQEIALVFEMREELLFPIAGNTRLLEGLKKRGFGLFFLSNFPEDMFRLLYSQNDFFRLFDGGVVSSAEKILKPQPEIYRLLVKRYGIDPSETLFIDDLLPNIEAAAAEGFVTLHLTDHSMLKSRLESILANHHIR